MSLTMKRSRIADTSIITGVAVLLAALWVGAIFLRAWAIMLLVGMLHAEAGLPPRTLGFWICVPIGLLLALLFNPGVNVKRSDS